MARFRIFGIPVQVDPWFVLGLLFIYSYSGGHRVGAFATIAIGVFTLVHELGHALVARYYGCEVSIRLNLFVGWASYSSAQPLSRRQQVVISLFGPLSQLGGALAAMGVVHQLFGRGTIDRAVLFDLWQGLSWAGVVIALLNLLPLWPLDGGHVVRHILGIWLSDRRALRAVLYLSLAGLAVLVVVGVLAQNGGFLADQRVAAPRRAAFALFRPSLISALWAQIAAFPAYLLTIPWFLILFSGLLTLQALNQLSTRPVAQAPGDASFVDASVVTAEARGWVEHRVPQLPAGWSASPWLLAHVALRAGDTRGADAALAQVTTGGRRWVLPDPGRAEIEELVARVPRPLPIGETGPSLMLARVLGAHGDPVELLHYCAALYERSGVVEALLVAAGALVRRGFPDDAMRWLERAMHEQPDLGRLATDPAFLSLHQRDDFRRLVEHVRLAT